MSQHHEQMSSQERSDRVRDLLAALSACAWEDAELVLSTTLYEFRTGRPLPPFGRIEDEAEDWAASATHDELMAYFIACARRLRHRQLGPRGRVKLVRHLLDDMPPDQRRKLIADLQVI